MTFRDRTMPDSGRVLIACILSPWIAALAVYFLVRAFR